MSNKKKLNVMNLDSARFECVYPTCGGLCCKNGRPPCTDGEAERIDGVLDRALPLMKSSARALVEKNGYRTKRMKSGSPMLAVVDEYCVFFSDVGCTLHRLGMEDGDAFMYKPWSCSTFPLDRDGKGGWYVRQHGVEGEVWDLFCLDPNESDQPAAKGLRAELAFAARIDSGAEDWRFAPVSKKKTTKATKTSAKPKAAAPRAKASAKGRS